MPTEQEMAESELLRCALFGLRKAQLFTPRQLRTIARVAQRNGYLPDAVAFAEAADRARS